MSQIRKMLKLAAVLVAISAGPGVLAAQQWYECTTTTTTTTETRTSGDGTVITTTVIVSQRICIPI